MWQELKKKKKKKQQKKEKQKRNPFCLSSTMFVATKFLWKKENTAA